MLAREEICCAEKKNVQQRRKVLGKEEKSSPCIDKCSTEKISAQQRRKNGLADQQCAYQSYRWIVLVGYPSMSTGQEVQI